MTGGTSVPRTLGPGLSPSDQGIYECELDSGLTGPEEPASTWEETST